MKSVMVGLVLLFLFVTGCVDPRTKRHSSNDIPVENRRAPAYRPIIISSSGPQLDPSYYEVMGKVSSFNFSVSISLLKFQGHCYKAIEMLRDESMNAGADALINVECGEGKLGFGASASGIAVAFKNRQECLIKLEEIKAVTK